MTREIISTFSFMNFLFTCSNTPEAANVHFFL